MNYEVRETLYMASSKTVYDITENGIVLATVFHKSNVDTVLEALKNRAPKSAEEFLKDQQKKLK